MSFGSNNAEDYIRIKRNPNLGLKYLFNQKLLNREKERKEKNARDNLKPGDDNPRSNEDVSDDEGYASDMSENEYVDIENNDYLNDDDSSDLDDEKNVKIKGIPETDVEFQILDIDYYHTEDESEKKKFNIMLFGKTREDKSVYVNVTGYKPYFYVEIDSKWRMPIIQKIISDIQKQVYPKQFKGGLISYKIIQAHKFHGFTDDANFNFLHLVFSDHDSMKAYARAFEKKHTMTYISRYRRIGFKLYESNMNPILRFLHIRNIDPVGWCKIPKSKFKPFEYNFRKGDTDYNICCGWDDVDRLECTDIHKFKILSFDIECVSEDGKFPQNRDGDKVIQIGMTYSYLGETECFKQVILCLKKTSAIPGAEVRCFNTEETLLLAFTDEIRRNDPDVITGYNIFGFDFDYLKNRAKKFNIYSQFSRLSRIKGFVCNYVEQVLASSALGRNNLKYYNMPGRVCIDLMKYVQREYKLPGYKLDNVAANFIQDDITGYEYIFENDEMISMLKTKTEIVNEKDKYIQPEEEEQEENDDYLTDDDTENNENNKNKKKILYTKLKVKSTAGINKDDYIALYYNDGPTDNVIGKKKHKVIFLDKTSIIVEGKIKIKTYLDNKWRVFWCQGKDDVEPKDIFRLFKGNEGAKAIIAKYCLKDCTLCNRLMAKLQILPNSVGMANVCCVPLSFLFLRGQSIKIFSLVSKQCREENYLIPTNKKKPKKEPQKDANGNIIESDEQKTEKRFQSFIQGLIKDDHDDDDDEDDEKYEGATVFDPIKGVHYEPIIVDDYSSLYPSSMIMKNLSHNSIVLDPQYDNLPGYRYHEQTYNNNDKTTTTYRFAEKLGKDPNKTKSTIPRILMKLLKTRKDCVKKKGEEKDPFKKAVWDGLQLAYKITANSLYGQCGSSVSPIAMKPIAACTTAIGRSMLELARDFAEQKLPTIINLIKDAVETNDDSQYLEYMREFYKNVDDSSVEMKEKIDVKDKDGKKTGEKIEQIVYEGKEAYYQWLKPKMYSIISGYDIKPSCIYGDTDSVFFKLNLVDRKTGLPFTDHGSLGISIDVGIVGTAILNHTLEYPQSLAYEKVYWPFTIISKKRYVGNLYSDDPNKFYQKSMGLVTKRRDNADIVKVVVGGIIDQILNKRSSIGAVKFTEATLMKVITGKYDIEKFIITKTLKDKADYAPGPDGEGWKRQAHVVLADRMAQRDPGNKPQSNDRIPFLYVEIDKKVKLQGERVEHPQYIKENKLKIDFLYYITTQIMKPATQFLELIVKNSDKVFNRYIIREENRKSGIDPIMKYYKECPTDEGNLMNVGLNGLSGESLFGEKPPKKNMNKRRAEKRTKIPKKIF
jgi:DNA polymerase elongation subunit (family B)